MAAGIPVVAFSRGAMPELIKDGKTGFLANNIEEAVSAVKKISQIDRYACRQHVENNFSIERMVEGYEEVYHRILKKK